MIKMSFKQVFGAVFLSFYFTSSAAKSYDEQLLFSYGKGQTCADHPLHTPSFKPEIIRSWHYAEIRPRSMHFEHSFYLPRYKKHTWAPVEDKTSEKYVGLDLFATNARGKANEEFATISFQREAKVYLMVAGWGRKFPPAKLPGWKSEGWATLVKGSHKDRTILGISQPSTRHVPRRVYVFSKNGEDVTLPNWAFVRAKLEKTFRLSGWYNILVAEKDGKPVQKPKPPAGLEIEAGGRCPQELHEEWKVKGHDLEDDVTRHMKWRTFHPLWDPCYWCAYDHEHGSDPKSLMGYVPRYHYTAWKNYRQDESHGGFKGIVLRVRDYFVYYGIHAHLSGSRRFFARHHTLVIAVTHAYTKKLQLELSFKADFGLAAARLKRKGVCPITKIDERIFKKHKRRTGMRLVNIVDIAHLDTRFKYNRRNPLLGQNEHWFTRPFCSTSKRRGVQVDFKNPGTALRTQKSDDKDFVKLGRKRRGVFVQRGSNKRDLRATEFRLAQELCLYKLSDIGGLPKNGKFYTDPFGKKILPGPGKYAIAQYIRPGFHLEINGKYQPSDTWVGLHEKGYRGTMQDIGFAIDPSEN